jgi:hypothetical protein
MIFIYQDFTNKLTFPNFHVVDGEHVCSFSFEREGCKVGNDILVPLKVCGCYAQFELVHSCTGSFNLDRGVYLVKVSLASDLNTVVHTTFIRIK